MKKFSLLKMACIVFVLCVATTIASAEMRCSPFFRQRLGVSKVDRCPKTENVDSQSCTPGKEARMGCGEGAACVSPFPTPSLEKPGFSVEFSNTMLELFCKCRVFDQKLRVWKPQERRCCSGMTSDIPPFRSSHARVPFPKYIAAGV